MLDPRLVVLAGGAALGRPPAEAYPLPPAVGEAEPATRQARLRCAIGVALVGRPGDLVQPLAAVRLLRAAQRLLAGAPEVETFHLGHDLTGIVEETDVGGEGLGAGRRPRPGVGPGGTAPTAAEPIEADGQLDVLGIALLILRFC